MIEPELLVATTNVSGQITFRNRAWKGVLGESDDPWGRLQDGDRETAARNVQEATGGTLVTHALFLVDRPGRDEPLPLLLHFVPVASRQGHAVSITGELLIEPTTWTESHTERHRMETLGRMTMGMAHDFNNLLSGILGHLELWRQEDPEGSHRADAHVSTIEQAASDGADLISKVQKYIRQESRSAFGIVDMRALLVDCMTFTRPYWYNEPRRQGIAISFDMNVPELPPVEGAASELRDVFVNLILNAVHAMPEGGSLSMTAEHVGTRIHVHVGDSGTGMSDKVRARIFEPLYSTKGEGGTGMGLSIAAGIVREHDGSISVESTVGEGSVFTLSFPVASSLPAARKQDTHSSETKTSGHERSSKTGTPGHIMIVDDEAMVRNVVSKLLELRGYTVHAASSGHEGLRILEEHAVDLIFTDQGMPEMSGREFAERVHARWPKIHIVLLTGDTDLSVDRQVIRRVLTKPFRIDDLTKAITDLS